MGIKAKHLLDRTNTLTVAVSYEESGETKEGAITVKHRVLTPAISAKLTQTKPKPEGAKDGDKPKAKTKDGLVIELLELLTEWDVEGEDGKPLPITEETLGRIDYKVLREIDTAIYRYTFPNLTT